TFNDNLCLGYYSLSITDAQGCNIDTTILIGNFVYGCTDSLALNFDPLANTDDSTCCGAGFSIPFGTQIGQDIDAEHRDDYNGYSVSYSDDGNRVAIGAIQNDNIQGNGQGSSYNGHVRIFENINENWIQVGQDIDGTSGVYEFFGSSVSLSSDGNIVAIGAPFIAPGFSSYGAGLVRVYEFDGTNWNQRGSDILASGGSTGYSVDVSDDGRKVIVGICNLICISGITQI
ncbi:hypothetical protein N8692_05020, partial [Flavobacteriales bacterium]|nr:hypothetical protein [Flavobacteriales bacterium]